MNESHRVVVRHRTHAKAVREAVADLSEHAVEIEGLAVTLQRPAADALVGHFKRCMDQPSTARQFARRQKRLRELIDTFSL